MLRQLEYLHHPAAGQPLRRTDKSVYLKRVETNKQKADLFTKDLDRMRFTQLAHMIGMRSKTAHKPALLAFTSIQQKTRGGATPASCEQYFIGDTVDLSEMD